MEKKHDTKYWQKQYEEKKLTPVDQEIKKGQKLNPVWKVVKRLALNPQEKELPTVYKTVKGFALCVPSIFWATNRKEYKILSRVWRRIASIQGSSAGAERIFSLSVFLLMARRWNLDPETLMCITLLHNWYKQGLC